MKKELEYQRPGWLQAWYSFDNMLRFLERSLLVVGLFLILIIGCFHVLARNLIGKGLAFSSVLAQHLTVWLGLLGATLAASSSEHISIDAFSRILRNQGLKANKVLIGAVSSILCGILTYRTVIFFIFAYQQGQKVHLGNLNLPLWCFLVIFPYAFGLITIRYAMQTIEYVIRPAHTFVNEQDTIKAEAAKSAQAPAFPGEPALKIEPAPESETTTETEAPAQAAAEETNQGIES